MNKTYTPFINNLMHYIITTLYIISILCIYNGVPAIKVYVDHAFALLGMFYIGILIPAVVNKGFPINYNPPTSKSLTDTLPISNGGVGAIVNYLVEGHFYIDEESKINFNQIIPATYINCLDRDITIIQYFKEIIISEYLLKDDVEIYITNITIDDIKCFKELK